MSGYRESILESVRELRDAVRWLQGLDPLKAISASHGMTLLDIARAKAQMMRDELDKIEAHLDRCPYCSGPVGPNVYGNIEYLGERWCSPGCRARDIEARRAGIAPPNWRERRERKGGGS